MQELVSSGIDLRKGADIVRVPYQFLVLALIGGLATLGMQPWRAASDSFSASTQLLTIPSPHLAADALPNSDGDTGRADTSRGDSGLLVQEPSRRRAQRPQLGNPLQNMNQRGSFQMLRTFRDALGEAWQSTVELLVDDERVAYGAIVDKDGWIVSKDSQIPRAGILVCRFADGTESLATVVNHSPSLDLALIRVTNRDLTPVQWSPADIPTRGRWVATTDTRQTPVAVGVVSAGAMKISPKKAVLGVLLDDAKEGHGALVQQVLRGTGAELAGLRVGDTIRSINGQRLADRKAALSLLESCRAGQSIQLAIARGENEIETRAQMMDLSHELHDETEMEVNGLISARSTGFSSVFLHDTVLLPTQCGGPLVDLNGQVVGINIARAGRVTSYALPVGTVRPEIERMLSESKASQVVPANASIPSREADVR